MLQSDVQLEKEIPTQEKIKGVFFLEEKTRDFVYGPEEQSFIRRLLDIEPCVVSRDNFFEHAELLKEAEIAMASWGIPLMDEAFLGKVPQLRAVFYAAGSIRPFITPAVWKRKITISSAYAVNAWPVAEYTLATILLSLKSFWRFALETKQGAPWKDHTRHVPGGFRSTVGLVSAGMIARRVLELMQPYDLHRVIYCPFLGEKEAEALKVKRLTLEEVFQQSDVVSLHTPLLPETMGMITGDLIVQMKPRATLINTARGGLIRQEELIEVLRYRSDLTAILDVTEPEPPSPKSSLFQLPNLIVTPHIAGSLGPECQRLGACMVQELVRYLAGQPLLWQITEQEAANLA